MAVLKRGYIYGNKVASVTIQVMQVYDLPIGPIHTDTIYAITSSGERSSLAAMSDEEAVNQRLKIPLTQNVDVQRAIMEVVVDGGPSETYKFNPHYIERGCEPVKPDDDIPVRTKSGIIKYSDAVKMYSEFSGEVEYMFEGTTVTPRLDKGNMVWIVSSSRVVPKIINLTVV